MPGEGASPDVQARIDRFKLDLGLLPVPMIVQKHITFGGCHGLDDDRYFELKTSVAKQFDLHPSEVVVVGSGKLGFSVAPTKRYREFTDTSDIDVAVVSPRLFDYYWMQVYAFKSERNFWRKEGDFNSFLVRGWIRPDMLPPAHRFAAARDWWQFYEQLTKDLRSDYKIRAGLYRAWSFLESYQSICVSQCHADLEAHS